MRAALILCFRRSTAVFLLVGDTGIETTTSSSAATHCDVVIMGDGDIIGQALEQGLIDELRLHVAPIMRGGGAPLFKAGTRQTCTGNAGFARRGTPCTSPTSR
jgi:dihydrofolate reductase